MPLPIFSCLDVESEEKDSLFYTVATRWREMHRCAQAVAERHDESSDVHDHACVVNKWRDRIRDVVNRHR